MQTLQTFVQIDMLPKKTDLKYHPSPPHPLQKNKDTKKQTNK